MAKTVYVEYNQDILDICLQETGSLNNLVAIHEANGFESLPAEVKAGDAILIPDDVVNNELVIPILQGKKPASINEAAIQELIQSGIDFMGIEIDFIVS